MTTLPEFTEGDVVELILEDHRVFEELLRQLRDETADREQALKQMVALLAAHEVAEEEKVYPKLRKADAISAHEAEHGREEHAEADDALIDLLDTPMSDTEKFAEAVEKFGEAMHHHLGEEEQDILNPARTEVDEETRLQLGKAFAERRATLIKSPSQAETKIRERVRKAEKQGMLEDD